MAQKLSSAHALAVIPEDALHRIPGCAAGARPDAVVLLPGGTVNTSIRVDTRAGCFVLRVNDAAGEVLGASHEREALLQAAAAAAGVAPDLIYADPHGRFMITRFIEGRVWSAADFARPECLKRLGTTLGTLHGVAPPAVAPFDLGAMLRAHSARLIEADPSERGVLESLMDEAVTALALCASGARQDAIVHNDLNHANVIEGERLYLIDWEYAAVADPIFDLACIVAYYPQAQRYARGLLDAAGLGSRVSIAVLMQAAWLFVLLAYLWYRLRRLTRGADAADLAVERALLRRLNR